MDKIDGYTNINYIDTVNTDMSAKVYVALEAGKVSSKTTHYMIYDQGYIQNDVLGEVFLKKLK